MSRTVVFDSSALLAYFFSENGREKVGTAINLKDCNCVIHAANVMEVCYKVAKADVKLVLFTHNLIRSLNITIDQTMDYDFQHRCAALKVSFPMLSLVDTSAISLAERFGCEIYTTDKEFSRVENGVEVVQLR